MKGERETRQKMRDIEQRRTTRKGKGVRLGLGIGLDLGDGLGLALGLEKRRQEKRK